MRMLVTLCAVVVAACGDSAAPAVVAKPAPAKRFVVKFATVWRRVRH